MARSNAEAPKPLVSLKINGWKSDYKSVEKVLRHFQFKGSGYEFQSYASVESYAEILNRFIRFAQSKDPKYVTIDPVPGSPDS